MNAHTDHIKGLDSIRGISMILVILTHMHLIGVGWVTIQTFFVMSGFLITRILLRLRDKSDNLGGFLKIFYARRTLRIFPIYYLFLIIFLLIALVVEGMSREREQTIFAFLYIWNWFAVTYDGKLSHSLEHFWSLAVEEQFYLCWPILVYFARGATFWRIALCLVLAGPFIRLGTALVWPYLDGVLPNTHKALYQMSTTHLDAFATGALLCYVVNHPLSRRFQPSHLILAALLAYIAGALSSSPGIERYGPYSLPLTFGYPVHMPENWQYVWGYTVLNLLSAGLLLLVAQGRFLNFIFQNRLLTRLGVITYGAYIFHLPLLHAVVPWIKVVQEAVGNAYWGTMLCAPIFILVVFALAEISYRYFESRFLTLKDRMFSVRPAQPSAAGNEPPSAAIKA
jgi:peptidoglycan/LPS O-acetylase OafA/YrhL